jgi:hypothetical protein
MYTLVVSVSDTVLADVRTAAAVIDSCCSCDIVHCHMLRVTRGTVGA